MKKITIPFSGTAKASLQVFLLHKKLFFLVVVGTFLFSGNTFSQQSLIVNPSFEVNPCTPCANCTASGWTGCAATPDVLNGDATVWCVNTPPQNGCTYVGICQGEYIGQQLACPFVAGRTYNMTVWLAYDNDYASTMALGNCVKDRNSPGNLQIYGGATSCAATTLLWSSGVLTSAADTWAQYTISFTAPVTCNYIMFKNDVAASNVLIDNFQLINSTTTITSLNATCAGPGNDGSATVTPPANGTNWNILWSNGQTTPTATGLGAGTYTVTLTDADGYCTAPITLTAVITGPPQVTATATPASICPGQSVQLNATVNAPPPAPCTYTLNMFDSFGDGWGTPSSVVIRVNGVVVGTYTLSSGSVGSATFSVYQGDAIQVSYTRPTSFSSEVSFEVRNASNAVVYTSGANPTNGIKWNGTANCGVTTPTYTYSWSPAAGLSNPNIANPTVSPASTTTYTVSVTASNNPGCVGQASTTVTVTTTTPTFTTPAAVCQGATPPTPPNTSNNGISGTWSPAAFSTASVGTSTLTFTPAAGQCGTTATLSLTVNAPATPTFTTPAAVCQGATPPTPPNPSNNGFSGTWSPAAFSTASVGTSTLTFTPTAGQCATTTTLSLTVTAPPTPTFTTPAAVCQGATPPTPPNPSNNGISGTWSPAAFNTSSAGTSTLTFTPSSGQCGTTATLSLTVNAPVTPTFTTPAAVCQGATPPTPPNPSNNGVSGTWSPAAFNTASAGTSTLTFTPTAGQCATTATLSLTVNPPVTPTFTTPAAVCQGATPPTPPNPSNNGINGTWSPAAFSTASAGTSTLTFTPTAGVCATTATLSLTVNPPVTPTFTAVGPFCAGDVIAPLPTTSNNGIAGTWAPAINNMATTTYTFTPTAGECATTATMTITIDPPVTPTFPPVAPLCVGDPAPAFPPSNEGITGTWNPAAISSATAGTQTYTFTPTAGQCATTATISVTVGPPATPTFTPVGPFCQGDAIPPLSTTSNEGITGTWDPSINNMATTTYTFSPTAGACATTASMTITIDAPVTPTFTPVGPYCAGEVIPALPTTSNNGFTGTWDPAINNTATTAYTFTPDAGQCATTATLTIIINPSVTPTFTPVAPFCSGTAAPVLPTTSTNGITGMWDAAVSNTASGTYTFTPDAGQCATTAALDVTVNPDPVISVPSLSTCSGTPVTLTASGATDYSWSPATGLSATTGSSVDATLTADQTYTITGTDDNGCTGTTTATVTIAAGLTVSVNPPSANICDGGSVVLTASGATNYTWTGIGVAPTNTATVTASPATTTTYTVDGETSGCTGSATVTVTVGAPAAPTFNPVPTLCAGTTAPALQATSNEGVSGVWDPAVINNTASGTYTFTPDAGECATTASISVSVNTAPTLSGVMELCNGTNTAYNVQVTLSGGDVSSYSMTENAPGNIGGSFAGNDWTSNLIPSGTAYNFDFDDASGCGPVNVSGVRNCNCSTSAGTMNTTPISLCATQTATATHNGNQTLDANDVLSYILHSASGSAAGTVYASSSTPDFSFVSPPLSFGVTYYISAVAGNNNGSGMVDLSDPCLSVAMGTPVVWNATPTAIPANNGPLCVGATLNLTSNTEPGGAYSWTGPNNFSVQNPTVASVTAADAGTYTLVITSNGCASAPVTTTVVVNTPVTPGFAPVGPFCQGAAAPAFATVSTEGISGSWNAASPSTASASTTTYTFTPTAGQCAATTTLNVTINALPVPTASSNSPVCAGAVLNLFSTPNGASAYAWSGPNSFSTQNPSIGAAATTDAGTYTVTVTVNGCVGVASTTVVVNTGTPPVINAAGPFCIDDATPTALTADIPGGTWSGSGITNPNGTFVPSSATAGTNTITYTLTAGCGGMGTRDITVNALPPVNISATPLTGCAPLVVVFTGDNGMTSSLWSFGDGAMGTDLGMGTISHTYTSPGTYDVSLTNTLNGCSNTAAQAAYITVVPDPVADFSVQEYELSVVNPMVVLTNQSTGAATYSWTFGDENGTSTATDPTYTYDGTIGTYTITLTATSPGGCVDVTSQTIIVKDQLLFFVPNTFTPDGDAYNNTFQPVFTSGYDPYNFSMYIFNRWGEIIFESHDVTVGWDGTYQGKIVPEGTYNWIMEIKNPQDDQKSRHEGHILLTR